MGDVVSIAAFRAQSSLNRAIADAECLREYLGPDKWEAWCSRRGLDVSWTSTGRQVAMQPRWEEEDE